MFKNLMLFRITGRMPSLRQVIDLLAAGAFQPARANQQLSLGWVPPRDQNGALIEAFGRHWLMKLQIERKEVPHQVLVRRADEMAQKIESETGRKPGRRLMREVTEEALEELLPSAFPIRTSVPVWLSCEAGLLAVETTNSSHATEVATILCQSIPGFRLAPLVTALAPAVVMANWLTVPDSRFTVDRDCELKSPDGEKATVRYCRHSLDLDEVHAHIAAGKRPTRIALTWNGRVAFVLTDRLQIRRLEFLNVVFDGVAVSEGESLDADMAIATGELVPLIADLVDALGGSVAPEAGDGS